MHDLFSRILRLFSARSWCVLIAMAVAPAAFAQNVLMLAVDDTGPADGILLIDRMEQDFIDNGAAVTRLDILQTPGAVTADTFVSPTGSYDFVLVSTVYSASEISNWGAIRNAIRSSASPAFFFFADGCPQCAEVNYQQMIVTLNDAAPFSVRLGPEQFAFADFPLNTNSPFAASFTDLDPLEGGFVTYLADTPADNALYLPTNQAPPAAGTTVNSYGFVLPRSQSHGGSGSCLFGTVDMTLFLNDNNSGEIAPAFTNALAAQGTCNLTAGAPVVTPSENAVAVPALTTTGLLLLLGLIGWVGLTRQVN